jgi:glycine betaine/choline ABC-type transport system substrate-binding protein
MQSLGLKLFVDKYGLARAGNVMNMSKQAVHKAVKAGRNIQIVDAGNGYIEAHESKILSKTKGSFPED